LTAWPKAPARNEFETEELGFAWNHVRNPASENYSLSARPGFMRLTATRTTMDDVASPTFVGRRQEHFRARVATSMEADLTCDGQEAGLVIRMNEDHHYDLLLTRIDGRRRVVVNSRAAGVTTTLRDVAVKGSRFTLSVEAYPDRYEFFYSGEGDSTVSLGQASTRDLSSEVAGGFTGVYVGIYAAARSGAPSFEADFDWFEYAAK
jgi:alpha-N-arabinofuranosidase